MKFEEKNKLLEIDCGKKEKKQRIGRGFGSSRGKHSQRGMNGQKSRSGCSIPKLFEGGQHPLYRRVRKYGFRRKEAENNFEVHLDQVVLNCPKDAYITPEVLKKYNVINPSIRVMKNGIKVKVVGGRLDKEARDRLTNLRFSTDIKFSTNLLNVYDIQIKR